MRAQVYASNPARLFNSNTGERYYRSLFDLSHEKKYTADMGQLIPHLVMEAIPGDIFDIGFSQVVRFQPLVAPILHNVKVKSYYFFVPYRLLWDDWEEFITRGPDGDSVLSLPVWQPNSGGVTDDLDEGQLWDMLGFPMLELPAEASPIEFPRSAYAFIWNEFFRDENLQTEVALDQNRILYRNWNKDYFTSSLPFQQRGTAPAMPINVAFSFPQAGSVINEGWWPVMDATSPTEHNFNQGFYNYVSDTHGRTNGAGSTLDNLNAAWTAATSGVAGDVADYRLMFQLQYWMEVNARAGVRYTEFLRAHFPASPRDDRLQRPEYIGGTSDEIIFSEVLQTSNSDTGITPQGNMAGHGLGVSSRRVSRYRVEEFGLIMGLSVVYPKSQYQNGLHRSWLRRTTFDFPFPEFALLSEQEVYNAEICALDSTADPDGSINMDIFGYVGRYDEMRYHPSQVMGGMRSTAAQSFDYWHLARDFDPATPPALNSDFIVCQPDKRIFAVQDEPGLIVAVGNHVKALRPLPIEGKPAPLFNLAVGGKR